MGPFTGLDASPANSRGKAKVTAGAAVDKKGSAAVANAAAAKPPVVVVDAAAAEAAAAKAPTKPLAPAPAAPAPKASAAPAPAAPAAKTSTAPTPAASAPKASAAPAQSAATKAVAAAKPAASTTTAPKAASATAAAKPLQPTAPRPWRSRPSPLQQLLQEMIAVDPQLSTAQLVAELRAIPQSGWEAIDEATVTAAIRALKQPPAAQKQPQAAAAPLAQTVAATAEKAEKVAKPPPPPPSLAPERTAPVVQPVPLRAAPAAMAGDARVLATLPLAAFQAPPVAAASAGEPAVPPAATAAGGGRAHLYPPYLPVKAAMKLVDKGAAVVGRLSIDKATGAASVVVNRALPKRVQALCDRPGVSVVQAASKGAPPNVYFALADMRARNRAFAGDTVVATLDVVDGRVRTVLRQAGPGPRAAPRS